MKASVLIVFVMVALSATAQQGQKNGQGKTPPAPEEIIKRFDTNSDSKISIEELNANEPGERLALKFDKIDSNKDGFIDAEELQARQDKRKENGGKGQGNQNM